MEEPRITVKFEFTDELGDHYEASSSFHVYEDIGCSLLEEIGVKLNDLLRQAGYTYRTRQYIFMPDVDEDEYDALAGFLEEYRNNKEKDE